uniref:GPN-loop GTPase 2 n=1 Tax=Salmo trutta TaxID=8032 RepID=A0A674E9S9_SALTR
APCGLSLLPFNLDFYTDVMDLTYLLDHLAADPFFRKFLKLRNSQGSYKTTLETHISLTSFKHQLSEQESMTQVLRTGDKANVYCFGDLEGRNLACNDVSRCGSRL